MTENRADAFRADAFRADAFRADLTDLAELSRPVDLHDRVLRASRRARARSAVAAVAVITVAVAGAGLAVWRRPVGPVLPSGPLHPVMLPLGDIPVMWDPGGTVVRDQQAFPDATLAVPSWPDGPECPFGELDFRLGWNHLASRSTVIQVIKAVRADVDDDGSEDLLVHLGCNSGFDTSPEGAIVAQVVAYSGDRLLGRVVASPRDRNPGFTLPGERDSHIIDVSVEADGTVRVDWLESSGDAARTLTRTYGWEGDGFTQVGEATDLQGPTGVELSIEARGERGVDQRGQDQLTVRVTVHNAGRARSSPLRLAMVAPAHLQPAGPGWDGCLLPLQTPWLNLTPSPGEFNGGFSVICPAVAIDPGQALRRQFHFLVGDGPNAALLSASALPRASEWADPSIPPGPVAQPDAAVLETISVEVDQQPPGVHERDRADNTVQFPMP